MNAAPPRILLININGSGMGHLSTCLAYANRLRDHARPVFLSLASAVEMIHDMGFEADYLVSPAWSRARAWDWNQQLALRLGMMLERVRPHVIVFDGTWPFHGMFDAAAAYGGQTGHVRPKLVWSDLTLYKEGIDVPISQSQFDLVIHLGELGGQFEVAREARPARKVVIPPVTLLRDDEILGREAARAALALEPDGRYALFSLGAGYSKDVSGIGAGLVEAVLAKGFVPVWAQAPITVKDVPLPEHAVPISVYPLARYMRAFDVFVGAAGYNTCCEVAQSGVPSLLVPNHAQADDQQARAETLARHAPVVVSPCETPEERAQAVEALLRAAGPGRAFTRFPLNGAEQAATEILALLDATPSA